MAPEIIDAEYYAYLLAWLIVPAMLFRVHTRGERLAGVLVYAYIAGFFISHWPGALVHASPAAAFHDSTDTIVGFRLSTHALLALAAGALFVPSRRRGGIPQSPPGADIPSSSRMAKALLFVGIIFWVASFTRFATLPSTSAVISAGKQCALLAICLFSWAAWRRGDFARFRIWLAASLALPVVTVLAQGFIGYGIAMIGTILMFVAMFYRPRWLLLATLLGGIFCGLSLWVVYAEHRENIRAAVWGGESFDARVEAGMNMLSDIGPFDYFNEEHLQLINLRLNQNELVGAAVRVTPQFAPYEYGDTIVTAVLALIPRAIWPEKPIVAGSGDYVSRHTLIEFAEGTSVGMGQVLEFYINFGVPAVIIGFFILGAFLRRLDFALIQALENQDLQKAQFYFLVGSGALQSGGALSEISGTMAGGAVLSLAVSRFLKSRTKRVGLPRKPGPQMRAGLR